MNEDFVTFELSIKLKEKGFREECLAYYNKNGILSYNGFTADKDEYIDIPEMLAIHNYGDTYDAPTISQVLKWLREKGIHIQIVVCEEGWYFEVWKYGYYLATFKYQSSDYSSYEQAAIAGIEYVLDNLI